MELGEKIRAAGLGAGLSQRQLCGEEITRNMLSQIENGSARPSVETLQYLARRLGKSVSFFLEEQAVTSPNQAVMEQARLNFEAGDFSGAAAQLENYRADDPVFDREKGLLAALIYLELARQALNGLRLPYAAELLDRAGAEGAKSPYYTPALERERLLLVGQARPEQLQQTAQQLPADDRELLLRARAALEIHAAAPAAVFLEAAGDRDAPEWLLLRGECHLSVGEYRQAVGCFCRGEALYPNQVIPRLEQCYRELEDYKMAYEYACKRAAAPAGNA